MSCGGTSFQPHPQLAELPVLPSPFGGLAWLVYLQRRWRLRSELQALNAAQLRDVGLTRAQIDAVLARPFWQS